MYISSKLYFLFYCDKVLIYFLSFIFVEVFIFIKKNSNPHQFIFFTFAIMLIGSIMFFALEDSTNFEITLLWSKLRPKIEALSHETLKRLGHLLGKSCFFIPNKNLCHKSTFRMSVPTKTIIESSKIGTMTNLGKRCIKISVM